MKFYKDDCEESFYWVKIKINRLGAAYSYCYATRFYKNGKLHNFKNAAYFGENKNKIFCLNGNCNGNHNDFTKKSWRKFVKMQVFL